MSVVSHFIVCFPTHGQNIPTFKPGSTVSGTVVLKLDSPLAASFIELSFIGTEDIKLPSEVDMSAEKNVKVDSFSNTQIVNHNEAKKIFFKKNVLLWGNYIGNRAVPTLGVNNKKLSLVNNDSPNTKRSSVSSIQVIDSGSAHTYHFNVTMPKVNMPISKKTALFEIKYILKASIYSESKGVGGKKIIVKEICSTPDREFRFEPIISENVVIKRGSLPFRSGIFLKDPHSNASSSGIKKFIKSSTGNDSSSSEKNLEAILFQPYPSYTPGELVDILVLVSGSKSIKAASFDFNEVIKCKKSSAPTIDDSDVPLLWIYNNKIIDAQPLSFAKLQKSNVSTDLGLMGRFMFTNLNSSESKSIKGTKINSNISIGSTNGSPMMTGYDDFAKADSGKLAKTALPNANSISSIQSKNSSRMQNASSFTGSIHGRNPHSKVMPKFKSDKVPIVPVPLGNLLSTDSYRFARIKFNLPSKEELCTVPSVFLDFEYNINITLTLSSSFSQSRKMSGKFVLRLITNRNESSGSGSGYGMTLHTGFSSKNQSISSKSGGIGSNIRGLSPSSSHHSTSNVTHHPDYPSDLSLLREYQKNSQTGNNSSFNGEIVDATNSIKNSSLMSGADHGYVEGGDGNDNSSFRSRITSVTDQDVDEQSFPNLQHYIQYGEKIPTPDIELVRIK
ncbi:hypothetical protein AYI69_g1202 [Smittium culicis]|uniref:Arrestin-like N-terminal domain-containing protein n=1 Tax=Smittium culicis TaxID=133412 RepID=A0A1R1YQX5_9FUNG|nr:hypothetical protein AYI69_g1202 [Smittium culicis]